MSTPSQGLDPDGLAFIAADEASSTLHLHLASLGLLPSVAPTTGTTFPTPAAASATVAAAGSKGRGRGKTGDKPTITAIVEDPKAPLVGEPGVTLPGGPSAGERFYVTTAINYTNGNPHIGHAYEAVTSDVIARYQRMVGKQVFFLTGTDEHGQKVATTAEGSGMTPIELCDKYAGNFRALNECLRISNDFFVRTTMPEHHVSAQELWKRCAAADDIYLSKYTGWYNVREETFVTENEAMLADFKDPASGLPLKKMEETSYFFRMSKYQAQLIDHIKKSPSFILPESRRNLILARLEEELTDLSVSRTTFDWGIPVPEGFVPEHVLYVWFDALSNYMTGINWLGSGSSTLPPPSSSAFWPATVHVIGKDIIWFHCVIWPTILMSAGLPLPKSIFAHGFIHDKDGRKMSKSLGNVIDPHDMIKRFPIDTFRYYLTKDPFGGDISFSPDAMLQAHNSELADVLGNLVHRAVNLCHKFCEGKVPVLECLEGGKEGGKKGGWTYALPIDLEGLRRKVERGMEGFALKMLSDEVMGGFRDVNKFLTEAEPWKMKGDDKADARREVVRLTLEAVYVLAHFLAPIMPYAATEIFEKLGTPPQPIPTLRTDLRNLNVGATVTVGNILFMKIEGAGEGAGEGGGMVLMDGKPPKEEKEGNGRKEKQLVAAEREEGKGGKKKGGGGGGGEGKGGMTEGGQVAYPDDFSKVDVRVGQMVRVWHHEAAERLFCEEIDVGEEKPRQIASGLREHYKLEEMEGRKVLVVCNLKAAKLAGFESQGMVLAASLAECPGKVVLLEPPAEAKVGERVAVEGAGYDLSQFPPMNATQMKKKKAWEAVVEGLKTDKDGEAMFRGARLVTAAGPCRAPGMGEGNVR